MTVVLAVIAILAVANPIVQGVLTAIQVGVTTDQSNRKGIEVPGNWVALGIGGRCGLVDGTRQYRAREPYFKGDWLRPSDSSAR